MAQTTQTTADLGQLVKTKYPGHYDDMSDADLGAKVLAQHPDAYADYSTQAPTMTPAQMQAKGNAYVKSGSNVNGPAMDWSVNSIGQGITDVGKGLVNTVMHPLGAVKNTILAQSAELDRAKAAWSAARDAYSAGDLKTAASSLAEAGTHAAAYAVPVIGPMATHTGELMASGHPGQAVGQLAANVVAGEAGPEAAGMAADAGTAVARAAVDTGTAVARRVPEIVSNLPETLPTAGRAGAALYNETRLTGPQAAGAMVARHIPVVGPYIGTAMKVGNAITKGIQSGATSAFTDAVKGIFNPNAEANASIARAGDDAEAQATAYPQASAAPAAPAVAPTTAPTAPASGPRLMGVSSTAPGADLKVPGLGAARDLPEAPATPASALPAGMPSRSTSPIIPVDMGNGSVVHSRLNPETAAKVNAAAADGSLQKDLSPTQWTVVKAAARYGDNDLVSNLVGIPHSLRMPLEAVQAADNVTDFLQEQNLTPSQTIGAITTNWKTTLADAFKYGKQVGNPVPSGGYLSAGGLASSLNKHVGFKLFNQGFDHPEIQGFRQAALNDPRTAQYVRIQ